MFQAWQIWKNREKQFFSIIDFIKMNIVLVLLLSINGISCLKNGITVNSLSTYADFVATIWQHDSTTPRYLCSGTIITGSHIVTAGHCVHGFRNYEIYVTAGRIDLDNTMSVMVHKIYPHHDFEKVYNPSDLHGEYWLNDIAILNLVYELTWERNIASMSWSKRKWTFDASNDCSIIGWNNILIDTTSWITLQWSDASILGDSCSISDTILLPNEIYAFFRSTTATLDKTDAGNSLICNKSAIGIIVGGRDQTGGLITVLTLAPYNNFIEYIIAGGVSQIKEEEFRGVVSIWESGHFRCGAFIILNRYIVTAAHCVEGLIIETLSVVYSNLEIPRINSASEWSSVESVEIHPLYSSISFEPNSREHSIENDIAVLKVKRDLPRTTSFQFENLPDLSEISIDTPCEILRWTPSAGDTKSKILTKSSVTILDHERNQGSHLGLHQFRAEGFYELPFATNKDIGNPIIFKDNVIGMVIAIDETALGSTDPVTCLEIRPYQAFISGVVNRT